MRMGPVSLALCLVVLPGAWGEAQNRDSLACMRLFAAAKHSRAAQLPMGEVVAWAGKRMVGAPYEPFTLEQTGGERLVVNLRTFDCVTFAESMLALARCVKEQTYTFDAFKEALRAIRYRGGAVEGYASRLHYFSDWIDDNELKGIVRNASGELGSRRVEKLINWMTTHRDAYVQLADSSVLAAVAETERRLSQRGMSIIPKEEIGAIEDRIRDGDIIAMASSFEGLDVGHVGIAVRVKGGSLRYMHAPDVRGNVRISSETLAGYAAEHSSFIGIIVARPVEPDTSSHQSKGTP